MQRRPGDIEPLVEIRERPVTLELGGKSPSIVLPDADLDPSGRTSTSRSPSPRRMHGSTPELMCRKAAWLYDRGEGRAREANTAKFLAADAGFFAADRALQTFGGMGYADEYHVNRYFRESRLMRIAPVSQELALAFLAQNVLGLPKSY